MLPLQPTSQARRRRERADAIAGFVIWVGAFVAILAALVLVAAAAAGAYVLLRRFWP